MLALAIEFSRCVLVSPGYRNGIAGPAAEGSHPQDRTVCHAGSPSTSLRSTPDRSGVLADFRLWSSGELASGLTGAPTPAAIGNRSPMVGPQGRRCQMLLRKEVIQPHLPVRLPCYDFTPIADPTFDGSLHKGWATGFGCYRLSWCDGRCVQGPGTYSPQRC